MNPFRSVTAKIILLVSVGTTLVLAIVLGYGYVNSRALILDRANYGARNLADSVALQLELEIRSVAEITETFATYVENAPPDRNSLLLTLKRNLENQTEIYGSAVAFEPYAFDPEVRAFAPYYYGPKDALRYVQLGTESYNYFNRPWYANTARSADPKRQWTEPYFDDGGGDIIMTTYTVPFFELGCDGARNRFRGLVTADVSVAWLTEKVSAVRVGKTGYAFLISQQGAFLAHPRKDLIMRRSIFDIAGEIGDSKLM
ncbi:MAG: cache domain-containing protein, partial [Pseudomonadota bacterium]